MLLLLLLSQRDLLSIVQCRLLLVLIVPLGSIISVPLGLILALLLLGPPKGRVDRDSRLRTDELLIG